MPPEQSRTSARWKRDEKERYKDGGGEKGGGGQVCKERRKEAVREEAENLRMIKGERWVEEKNESCFVSSG